MPNRVSGMIVESAYIGVSTQYVVDTPDGRGHGLRAERTGGRGAGPDGAGGHAGLGHGRHVRRRPHLEGGTTRCDRPTGGSSCSAMAAGGSLLAVPGSWPRHAAAAASRARTRASRAAAPAAPESSAASSAGGATSEAGASSAADVATSAPAETTAALDGRARRHAAHLELDAVHRHRRGDQRAAVAQGLRGRVRRQGRVHRGHQLQRGVLRQGPGAALARARASIAT